MKTAIILGSSGQDGKLLRELLEAKNGYQVIGIDRKSIQYPAEFDPAVLPPSLEIFDPAATEDFVKRIKPDEVYHLAAYHHSSEDHPQIGLAELERFYQTNVLSHLCFLEAIRKHSPHTRLFYAASSHVFGHLFERGTDLEKQTEQTPFSPDSEYGITKVTAILYSRFYRRRYRVFVSVGILYNHESSYRRDVFISKKIVKAALRIYQGDRTELHLGNLDAKIDWGYAGDFVEAMHAILQTEDPDDFVVATGELHTVQNFVEVVFDFLGLDWRKFVREDHSLVVASDSSQTGYRVGNIEWIRKKTGWYPKTRFTEMVRLLLLNEAENQGMKLKLNESIK